MTPLDAVSLDGGRVLASPRYADLLRAHGLATFDAVMTCRAGQVFRTLDVRENVRLDLDGTVLFAKRHRPPGFREQVWRALTGRRPSSYGRREWEAVARLAAAGIPTLERVAMGERRWGPIGRASFFIARELTGYRPADAVLSEMPEAARSLLVDAIAVFTRRFHAAGFNHRDFYLCHLFVRPTPDIRHPTPDTRHPMFELALIDLQRVERRRRFRRRWLVKDLAQLAYSARGLLSEAAWEEFLRVYFGTEGLGRRERRFAAAVRRKEARIARHDRRLQARRLRSGNRRSSASDGGCS